MKRIAAIIGLVPTVLVLAVTAAGAGPVVERRQVVVVPVIVEGPYGDASISSIFGQVAATVSARLGLELISGEEVFVADPELIERVQGCGPDERCLAERLAVFRVRFGLLVVVNKMLDPPLLALRLVDTEERKVIGARVGPVSPEEGTVTEAVRARAAQLFDEAGHLEASRIVVRVDPPDALVTVGEPQGTDLPTVPTSAYRVVAGLYVVQATRDGFHPARVELKAESGREHVVDLVLERETAFYETPWFWVVVGSVAVAGTVTAVWVSQRPGACVCVAPPGTPCNDC